MQTNYFAYIGTATYGGIPTKLVYLCKFDTETGQISSVGPIAETVNPGFLAVSPDQRYLYVENEVAQFRGAKGGGISSFLIDQRSGKLRLLNEVSSGGAGPAHLTIDRSGRYVLVANYHSGSVAVFPREKDGRLGDVLTVAQATGSSVHPVRQRSPHPHAVYLAPNNRFVLVPDLGLDQVLVYRFDSATGHLEPSDPPFATVEPGAGPRHLTFSPDQRFAYVLNEMQSSITVFAYDAMAGKLQALETISILPAGFDGENFTAELQMSKSGKILYASNRGADTLAVLSVCCNTGKLTLLEQVSCGGKTPRYFSIDPSGSYVLVANQDSHNIRVLRIEQQTGQLTMTDQAVEVPSPVCIAFVADVH